VTSTHPHSAGSDHVISARPQWVTWVAEVPQAGAAGKS
jgi:hypothetical protein